MANLKTWINSLNPLSHVSDEEKMLFAKHLALMSRSGISLSEAIIVLIQQTKSGMFKHVLQGVLADIENGQSFSKSLARYPNVFDAFEINIIEIGESSGNFSKNLAYLADQLEKSHAFRSKVRGAMLYPAIVLTLAVIIGMGVSIFALPQLINVFQSFNVPLPLNTRILIWLAKVMQAYGSLIVGGFLGLIVLFRILIKFSPIKYQWDRFVLRIPAIGALVENTQLTLLCRNLGVMLQGGVPITTALDIQARDTDNLVYKNYVLGIREAVGRGMSITSHVTASNYRGIPLVVVKMVDVGEKTGKLDEAFLYLGDFFESQVDELTTNITVVLEPLLIFVIASIVAFVALAIITPIYQLTGSINPAGQ